MHFNVCVNLTRNEIKKSLKYDEDVVLILLYQERDKMIRDMLINDSDFLNSASSYTNIFTYIDSKVRPMEPVSNHYGANDFDNIPDSRTIYNKMLFIGSTFGVGNKYPVMIVYRPSSGEYVNITMSKLKVNEPKDYYWFIVDNILIDFDKHKKDSLKDIFPSFIDDLKVGSFYNIDNFDKIDELENPRQLLLKYINLVDRKYLIKELSLRLRKKEDTIKTNLSQWINDETRKPSSIELKEICSIIGLPFDERNLLLTAFDNAPLNPRKKEDKKYFDEINNNKPIIID